MNGSPDNPRRIHYGPPAFAESARNIAGRIVFVGMAEEWAQNPDFGLFHAVERQVRVQLEIGVPVDEDKMIADLRVRSEVLRSEVR